MNRLIITLFVVFIVSCKTTSEITKEKFEMVVKNEFSDKPNYIYNSDSTRAICIGNQKNMGQTFSFFVYSFSDNKKMTDIYSNVSEVKWEGDSIIKYKKLAGTIQLGAPPASFYVINLEDLVSN